MRNLAKWCFKSLDHLYAVRSSLARVTCETSQVLLAGGQVVFLGDLQFSSYLTIDSAQNKWNNLDGPLNPNGKKKKNTCSILLGLLTRWLRFFLSSVNICDGFYLLHRSENFSPNVWTYLSHIMRKTFMHQCSLIRAFVVCCLDPKFQD